MSRIHRLIVVMGMLVSISEVLVSVTGGAFALQPGDATDAVNIEIIVDSSGSMAAETDTQAIRMDSAKTVLREVIGALPDDGEANVGLRLYGHEGDNTDEGREESCAASDLVVPIDGVDKDALTTQVNALVPTGWTPLGASLEAANEDLEAVASDESTNVAILLTDGIETCDGDPVAAAAAGSDGPASITTHVIGFATAPEDAANLEAIANAGNGDLLNAANAGQLFGALFEVLEELDIVDEGGNGESRDAAIGVGREGTVGDYLVTVISVTPNANDIVAAENQFNDPPAEGKQFFIARVSVTYAGDTSGLPAAELDFQAVGASNVGYATFTDTCGVIPDDGFEVSDLFPGGAAEFNVCWAVDSADADSLVMYAESYLDFNGSPVWFSVGNSTPVADDEAEGGEEQDADAEATEEDEPNGESTDRQDNGGDGTARESPVAIGTTADVGDYSVTVLSVTLDADDIVAAENQFNEPPAEGKQFALVRVEVIYNGADSGYPAVDLNFQSVGESNVGYATFTDTCGVIPDDSYLVTDVFQGGSAEFNVCWAVDSSDIDSLVMYVESFLDFNADPVWFSLDE